MTLQDRMKEVRQQVNAELERILVVPETRDSRVVEAMRYSVIGTGKALRPFLVMTIGELLGISQKTALRIGVAIEMLHTFSLIHDDLPAIDNDTLRRGKPTNHVQFDEATAIMAGDGLLTKSFAVLSDPETSDNAEIRSKLVQALADGCGKMIRGEMLDIIGETQTLNLDEIEYMQTCKTGALLEFSCIAPAIAAGSDETVLSALKAYAKVLGLMFQITDDILDVEGDIQLVGKTLGKDVKSHKSTFVSILGLDKAKELVKHLYAQGIESLIPFGEKADILREVLAYIIERKK
ncbi:MAG: polyprenyl synthetase family protein [Alphaproteobacteria bacterium]|nr:polyprenyl synthetase family protein [Alphaproteobacteria bacterium]